MLQATLFGGESSPSKPVQLDEAATSKTIPNSIPSSTFAFNPRDAFEEVIAHAKKPHPMLVRLLRFHRQNPAVLHFIVSELRATRANGRARASFGSLWHYSRWCLTEKSRPDGESYTMSQNLCSWYSRIVIVMLPEFNGYCELAKSAADDVFELRLVSGKIPSGRVRRLQWADGAELTEGWRPTMAYQPPKVPIARRERTRRSA